MEFGIESAYSLDDNSYSPCRVPSVPTSESVASMPTTDGREENASRVLADCTISGDRGMLVFQAAEPDKIPVSAEQGIRFVTMRLCAIVGVAMLITAGLLWFSGMRQSANFPTQSDEKSPAAENAATIAKPIATAPPLPAPEAAPTDGTPTPM